MLDAGHTNTNDGHLSSQGLYCLGLMTEWNQTLERSQHNSQFSHLSYCFSAVLGLLLCLTYYLLIDSTLLPTNTPSKKGGAPYMRKNKLNLRTRKKTLWHLWGTVYTRPHILHCAIAPSGSYIEREAEVKIVKY